jgi:protein-tyrosine-phosphatase
MAISTLHQPPEFIKLLANDLRWSLLKLLAVGDYRVHELVEQVAQPMNLVSYHLKKMRDDALVTTRRSDADGRDVYYSLDLDRLREMYLAAGGALHPSLGLQPQRSENTAARVLFVCTHNSARSQMAEGLLRHLSSEHVAAYSAGSRPTQIHPDAIHTMDMLGIDIRGHRTHHLREFEAQSFDYVITVCDRAREVCPAFPGGGQHIHWGFPDPVLVDDAEERAVVFEQTALRLKSRISYFLTTLSSPEDEEK